VYPVELIFSPKKAHIVIEVSGEYNSSQVKKQTPSTAKRSKSLSDKEKRELEEGKVPYSQLDYKGITVS